MNAVGRLLARIVRGYQVVISPMLPPSCRFAPSCSQYAIESLQNFGAARGSYLTVRRLLRCHPWHRGGLDPVPDTFRWSARSPVAVDAGPSMSPSPQFAATLRS